MDHMGWSGSVLAKEQVMISGIGGGGGGGGMPSMDAMRQVQQQRFSKADADASGGLDATEFESMMKNRPMGGQAPGGASKADAFKKIDGDGDGQLTLAEMEAAHQKRLDGMQSTMQAFGQTGSTKGQSDKAAWETLLQSIGNGGNDKQHSRTAMDSTDDLVAELRALVDKVSSTYSSAHPSRHSTLILSA